MVRSTHQQMAQRVNGALKFLKRVASPAKAVALLSRRHRMSRRQAHRYVQQALAMKRPVEVPERKIVFTVKLPEGLVDRLRRFARVAEESLSVLVTRALEAYLRRGGHG